jgi:hypothetical protein
MNIFSRRSTKRFNTTTALFTTLPYRLLHWVVPLHECKRSARKEILSRQQDVPQLCKNLIHNHFRKTSQLVRNNLMSPALWMGLSSGLIARYITRLIVTEALSPMSIALAYFASAAISGAVAGSVAFLSRIYFLRRQRHAGARYDGKVLRECAAIGMLGGVVGSCAAKIGTLLGLTMGASAGIVGGLLYAVISYYKTPHQQWRKLATRGLVYGTAGGVIGMMSSAVFSINGSWAMSSQPPPASSPYPPSPVLIAPNSTPLVMNPGTANLPLPPAPSPTCVVPPPHVTHHVHRIVHHKLAHPQTVEPPKPVNTVVEELIIIELPPPPLPAPPPMMPPPVQHFAPPPCDGDCNGDCGQRSDLDLKGPCADPRMPCAERVSFDANGDPVRAVLEPQTSGIRGPHFEVSDNDSFVDVSTPSGFGGWNYGVPEIRHNSYASLTADNSSVSLVVPFGQAANSFTTRTA